jgi:hypothetical protein
MLDEWVHEEAREVGVGADLELSPTINQEECGVCGKKADLVTHHLSYEDEETLNVCTKCHHDIHHTDEYTDLQPDMSLEEAKQNGLL